MVVELAGANLSVSIVAWAGLFFVGAVHQKNIEEGNSAKTTAKDTRIACVVVLFALVLCAAVQVVTLLRGV